MSNHFGLLHRRGRVAQSLGGRVVCLDPDKLCIGIIYESFLSTYAPDLLMLVNVPQYESGHRCDLNNVCLLLE